MAKRKPKPPTRREIIAQSRQAKAAELVAMRNPPQREKVSGKIIIKTGREPSADFYTSDAWRAARFDALQNNDGCCELCGRSKRRHGVVLHVDHIKPRSKFPALALDRDNLQILCEDCNMGKGNRDEKDWRSPHPFVELAQMISLHIAIQNSRATGETAILVSVETLEALISGFGGDPNRNFSDG